VRVLLTAVIAAVAAGALLMAGPLSAAPSTAPANDLRAYVLKVQPIIAKVTRAENSGLAAMNGASLVDHPESLARAATGLRTASAQITAQANALRAVRAPADLVGPQSSLRTGLGYEARGLLVLAAALAHYDGPVGLSDATDRFTALADKGAEAQRQWAQEVTVQLRARGITVPLWVKTFTK
jgi:hypothetical protein